MKWLRLLKDCDSDHVMEERFALFLKRTPRKRVQRKKKKKKKRTARGFYDTTIHKRTLKDEDEVAR